MSHDASALERFPTGVAGLDALLEGGLLRGGVYIVEGPPGAGKTILANQMCFAAVRRGENVAYVTLLAESHARMLAHLRRMSFFDPAALPEKVSYLSAFKVLEAEGITALQTTLRKAITARSVSLLVLDGLVSAEECSPTPKEFRKFIHELQSVTAMSGCVGLLLTSTERDRTFRPEQTMVDGIIELSDEMTKLRSLRHLRIPKFRGTAPIRGKHTVLITDDGIAVVPRVETQRYIEGSAPTRTSHVTPGTGHVTFGIRELDEMLHGGLPSNSVTMLLGPSGSGKTILSLQFLAEGARRNEPGVYFGFYESPAALLLKSERIRLGIAEAKKKDLLELVWTEPVEGMIDVLAARLFATIERTKARRLVIDGIHGFQIAADAPERIRDVFSAIANELERRGITTLYTVETRDLFGPKVESPVIGVSAITHNILLLRHVELNAQLYRLFSILKLRDGSYDSAIREFRISDAGIVLADTFRSANHVLSGSHPPSRRGVQPKKRPRSTKKRARG